MDIQLNLTQTCTFVEFIGVGKQQKWFSCSGGTLDNGKTCPRCKGTGYEPTEFGKELLDFIKKYGK